MNPVSRLLLARREGRLPAAIKLRIRRMMRPVADQLISNPTLRSKGIRLVQRFPRLRSLYRDPAVSAIIAAPAAEPDRPVDRPALPLASRDGADKRQVLRQLSLLAEQQDFH